MQMPIVDGLTSTKMIRTFEKLHVNCELSARASANGRVPIIAVSASLVERERQTYINAGFDAWILKPIDFKRLNVLLTGIVDEEVRNGCLYEQGQWERGGWFERRQLGVYEGNTVPSNASPVATLPKPNLEPHQSGQTSTSSKSFWEHMSSPGIERALFVDERHSEKPAAGHASTKTVTDQ